MGINGNQRDNSAQSAGAVYVFARTGIAWSQQAYVKPSEPGCRRHVRLLGVVERHGSVLAVGSFDEDGSGRGINPAPDNRNAGSGAAYVFTRVGASWSQQAYIKPSNSEPQDSFGVQVALSDDGATLLAAIAGRGLHGDRRQPSGCDNDSDSDLSTGAAYVFVRAGNTWSQQAFLKPSNTGGNDWFGARVALSGDGSTAAIGATFEDGGAKGINGAGRQLGEPGRGRLRVHAQRNRLAAARLRQRVEHRGVRRVRQLRCARCRWQTLVASARGEDSVRSRNEADNSAAEAGAVYVFAIAGAGGGAAQLRTPDLILTNGKVVTVDREVLDRAGRCRG